jgi:hypothetical protein
MTRRTLFRGLAPVAVVALGASVHAPARLDDARPRALHAEMRMLWEDHVSWTRMYLVSASANLADKDATLARLMRNQEDLGDAMKPFYGDSAGRRFTELLKEHISIAGEIVAASRQGDKPKAAEASNRWGTNADHLATFLAGANSANWKFEDMRKMLQEHLDLTTREVTAHLDKDWKESIEAYDKVRDQALMMADALTEGLMKQFPHKAAL